LPQKLRIALGQGEYGGGTDLVKPRNGLAQKVAIPQWSAKGAKYDSQGQALSNAKRVAPGSQTLVE